MQTIGPYALRGALGTCDVGGVWSAADNTGQPLTIAVLDAAAASNQGWRDAFMATAYALSQAQDDTLPIVNSDYAAPTPWVACADERGPGAAQIFVALGLEYRPVAAGPPSPAQLPGPAVSPNPAHPSTPAEGSIPAQLSIPVQGPNPAQGPNPVQPPNSAEVASTQPAWAQPTPNPFAAPDLNTPPPNRPVSGTPISGTPVSGALQPISAAPVSPYFPGAGGGRQPARRMGLWIVVAAVLALAVGAGGAVALGAVRDDGGTSTASPTPTAAVDIGLPSAQPAQPGVEPPQGGRWPTEWPTFGPADQTKTLSNLPGLGFSFRIPQNWDCIQAERTSGYVKYSCGRLPEIGGDLIVRQCPKPCTDDKRIEMRMAEEAWGVRWIRSGPFATWGQTNQVNSAVRYGLVYVGYWRSVPEDAIDRQLVFRMTAPPNQANDLRKVVNSIRDVTFTI